MVISIWEIKVAFNKHKPTHKEKFEEPQSKVPQEYHDFQPLFTMNEADKLPLHQYIEYEILLKPDTKPAFRPLYSISSLKLGVVVVYLKENHSKGFIQAFSFSSAIRVLFIKQANWELQFYVDCQGSNNITVEN